MKTQNYLLNSIEEITKMFLNLLKDVKMIIYDIEFKKILESQK